ncbi:hypothetical protein V5F41_21675 [Xanthobacter autotrophicus]|uniref:hypothetical protein n=1 Tax=Xanthobacter autotrophicus TaxID=280 RepID=UPI003729BC4B
MALFRWYSGRRCARRLLIVAASAGLLLLPEPFDLHAQVGGGAVQLPQPPPPPPPLPGPEQLVTLVRSVLLAVNDANLTGNYTVLRDLTAPESQKFNTPESLGESFGPIRQQGTDFSIVAVAAPEFRQLPAFTPKGLLRLNGEFITDPRITFDIFYQKVENRWRPYAIGIGVVPVPPEPPPQPQPAKPAQAKKPVPPKEPKRAPSPTAPTQQQ